MTKTWFTLLCQQQTEAISLNATIAANLRELGYGS